MALKLRNIAFSGYRSFDQKPQYFENFEKINLIIGQNNSGKSNILRFLHEVLGDKGREPAVAKDPLARHLPSLPDMWIGRIEHYKLDRRGGYVLTGKHRLLKDLEPDSQWGRALAKLFYSKAEHDKTNFAWNFANLLRPEEREDSWKHAMSALEDEELYRLWSAVTSQTNGSRVGHWSPELIQKLRPAVPKHDVVLIPAIRQIGAGGTVSDSFDGLGIIDRLAKLQDPDVHNQESRQKFEEITAFVRAVLDSPLAKISIPYQRDTILIHMSGKVLPIESLGSGIHEVIILAAAATVLNETIVCIEEPEIHLNPVLQKKLLRYLSEKTNNQYFIATHSAALMDTKGAEIYHVTQDNGASRVTRVTSNTQRSNICEDLGYHPSDILQANCVIWVEGPSDRIYLNYWIRSAKPSLIEGVHYSIMFYGGRLAAHVSNLDIDQEIDDFISLRRLNQRGAILIDSDRASQSAAINATKSRLKKEFGIKQGYAWITQGREVENYLPPEQIVEATAKTSPRSKHAGKLGKFDNVLSIVSRGAQTQANKVKVARYIVENFAPDFTIHDLEKRINDLTTFISESNKTQILD